MSIEESNIDPNGCGGDPAPYVLGALTDAEHDAFVIHMSSCAVCREEVAALQVVAANLPAAAPQLSAPPELKRRVMATVQQEARLRQASASTPARDRARRRTFAWRPALAAAGVAVVALLAVIVFASGGSGTGSSTRVISAQVTPTSAKASLRLNGKHAELDIADMPQLPANRVYEVWVERDGAADPTDALFTVTRAGKASVNVPGDLQHASAVMVTAEPLGGSRKPTSLPVILARLT
jgi:anti-sigma-K factor RskA